MFYKHNGKNYKIPDDYIEKAVKKLGLSKAEAVQMYLEDEGIEINLEQENLTAKAVSSGVQKEMTRCKSAKKREVKRERKADPTKEKIISNIANFIGSLEGVADIQILNAGKLIGFSLADENYTINLVRNRKPKN